MGAVIYHHGPGLTFPIQLPAGNEIGVFRTRKSFTDSVSFTFGNWVRVATMGQTAVLYGPRFGDVPANKGQTFDQVGTGSEALVARRQEVFEGIHRERVLSSGHPNFSTLKAAFVPPARYESLNPHLVRLYRSTTYLRSVNGRTTGIAAAVSFYLATATPPGFSDEYELFRFQVGSHFDYGWLELSLINNQFDGPDFTPIAYAYDTGGKPMRAGYIPEPRELPLALSALSLGAIGLREWRSRHGKPAAP